MLDFVDIKYFKLAVPGPYKESPLDIAVKCPICGDSKYKKSEEFCGLPMYPFEQLEQYIDVTNTEILLTIGYNNMNQLRKVKYE